MLANTLLVVLCFGNAAVQLIFSPRQAIHLLRGLISLYCAGVLAAGHFLGEHPSTEVMLWYGGFAVVAILLIIVQVLVEVTRLVLRFVRHSKRIQD